MLFSLLVSFLVSFVCVFLFVAVVVVVIIVVMFYLPIFIQVIYKWQGRALVPSVIAFLCNVKKSCDRNSAKSDIGCIRSKRSTVQPWTFLPFCHYHHCLTNKKLLAID